MKIVNLTEEGTRNLLENMLKRSPSQYGDYENKVKDILQNVQTRGDEAVFEYTKAFDHVELNESSVRVTPEEIQEACRLVDQ